METRIRTRFGIKTNFPFGLFPNAGIAILYLSKDDFAKLERQVADTKNLLTLFGYSAVANRIVMELG